MGICKQYKRRQVFLSSTFRNLINIRKDILQAFNQANIFFFAMEYNNRGTADLSDQMKMEIEKSDIFVLLLSNSHSSTKFGVTNATKFEFEYACKKEKPVLCYLQDVGTYGEFSDETMALKKEVMNVAKYLPLEMGDHTIPLRIISDIYRLVAENPNMDCWIKAGLSNEQLTSILKKEQVELENQKDLSDYLWNVFTKNNEDTNDCYGRLIDGGLMYPRIIQSVAFFKPPEKIDRPMDVGDQSLYTYYLHRFDRYGEIVYDKMLDLSWIFLSGCKFEWKDVGEKIANRNWTEPLSDEIVSLLNNDKITWRLPTITELSSLITKQKYKDVFIDSIFKTDESFWFWSSDTVNEAAFYIETINRNILLDSIADDDPHRKAVFLCANGCVGKEENRIVPAPFKVPEIENIDLAKIDRIYTAYLSNSFYNMFIENKWDIDKFFNDKNFYYECFTLMGSCFGSEESIVREKLKQTDYYLFVHNDIIIGKVLDRTQLEVKIATELDIPVFEFIPVDAQNNAKEFASSNRVNIGLSNNPHDFRFGPNEDLKAIITQKLVDSKDIKPRPGWIKTKIANSINQRINRINNMTLLLQNNQENLENLINKSLNKNNVKDKLLEIKAIIPRPAFGTRTRFISRMNPVSRFYLFKPTVPYIECENNPILFETVLNRFQRVAGCGEDVVFDSYLNLYWNTKPKKHRTFTDAQLDAKQHSEKTGTSWRLPTVNELVTLGTSEYGMRKYMDEEVFPIGRWYWTSIFYNNLSKDQVYFVDFNYLNNCVGIEKIDDSKCVRTKSVLFVTENTLKSKVGAT